MKTLAQKIQEQIEGCERRVAYLESLGKKHEQLLQSGFENDRKWLERLEALEYAIQELRCDFEDEARRQEEIRILESENPQEKWGEKHDQ